MLKHAGQRRGHARAQAAAFGRLCVETISAVTATTISGAAAFGRLCVETPIRAAKSRPGNRQPPSGGCVLKHVSQKSDQIGRSSRLRAAVC